MKLSFVGWIQFRMTLPVVNSSDNKNQKYFASHHVDVSYMIRKKIKYSCYRKVAFADWKATLMHLEMLISGRFSALGLKALKERNKQKKQKHCPKGCFMYSSYIPSNFLANSFGG